MDDFGLPKGILIFILFSFRDFFNLIENLATISKVIKDYTPEDIKCSSDTRDLILDCSMGNYSFNI